MRVYFLIFSILICNVCLSQQEASVWYFGKNAGLDFSSGSPVPLSNGQINTVEGVASICDKTGALLFYTEGQRVWNAYHTVMPNGTGLLGDLSSTQSAIIVPFINDPLRYYIFTVDQLGNPNGLNYSIVNMALDNGKGDIESKNIQLLTPVCEKITAVKHCNGRDIWVLAHQWNSDAFYAYLITGTGITPSPAISNCGQVLAGLTDHAIGYMKASPDGTKLALANSFAGLDLCDFDASTGIVSNARPLFIPADNYTQPYGVEFSPDASLLYVTVYYFDAAANSNTNLLLQYDVSQATAGGIITSKQVLYRYDYNNQVFGALQMAPDGKMYMTQFMQPFLSVIYSPDQAGAACDFRFSSLSLAAGTNSTLGLPSFIQSYWLPGFTFTGVCQGQTISFNYLKPLIINSVKWDFGDPASGVNNTSLLLNPVHLFSSSGIFTVKLIRFFNCGSDTVSKLVTSGTLAVDLGKDTGFCGISQVLLDPKTPGANTYLWQDSTTAPVFTAIQSGLYWVEVKSGAGNCVKRDSIRLSIQPNPNFTLGPDLVKCQGEAAKLEAAVAGAAYVWSTGANTNSIQVTQTGIYWVDVNLNGCVVRDSLQAVFNPLPVVQLGTDQVLCEGQTLLLDAQNPGAAFTWQDGSLQQTFLVHQSGTYSVSVNRQNCIAKDTIRVSYSSKPRFTLGPDQLICSGKSIILSPPLQNGVYLWQDGSTAPVFTVIGPGRYYLTVTNNCGSQSDSVVVMAGACKLYAPNAFTPNGDGRNDLFKTGFGENVTAFSMEVYNRYGEQVFVTHDKNKGWDGTYKGKEQPNGSYVWIIQYQRSTSNIWQQMNGTVLLIR